ncbi:MULTISPECIES: GspH/FimT family pseudopilin [Thiorhodovibrio]|uniref:GspH/FimT family pseudopilin n=1 Tax=Thiorhodovibrio TaxID=61593 RepID=UPI0019129A34|nr:MULTISPECIES: GspH/FimT family pseudopilin [Thiorhodovibrio]MBK5969787.1 hypothetical protein [Thiorhodovibrio winogradskyi]WPL12170.1 putative major pilin subunit [Thiorhodovibrio litoralis]
MNKLLHRSFPSLQRGTTLLELLVTISIAAILMSVAVPSFQSMMRTNRIASVTNEMVRALMLARSEAVSRGLNVSLCNTANPNADSPSCAGGTWATGWIVFIDQSPSDGIIANPNQDVLRVGSFNIDGAEITSSDYPSYLTYVPTGRLNGNFSGPKVFNVTVDSEQKVVEIENTGRVRSYDPD